MSNAVIATIVVAAGVFAATSLPLARAEPAPTTRPTEAMGSYLAHLAAAEASLRLGEPAAARRWLAAAPHAHRGFEHRWLASRTEQASRELADLGGSVWQLAISSDGSTLAAAMSKGAVIVLDRSGKIVHRLSAGEGDVYRVAFSPDDRLLAAGGADRAVRLWDLSRPASPRELLGFETPVTGVAFSPDGKTVFASGYTKLGQPPHVDGTIKRWHVDSGAEQPEFRGGGVKPLSMLDVSNDGKSLVAGSWDGEVWKWDLSTGERAVPIQFPDDGPYNAVNCVAFDPTGLSVVAGSKDNTARVFDLMTRKELHRLRHGGWVTSARFTPDAKHVVTGCSDELVRIWDASRGELVATLAGHVGGVSSVVPTPDHKCAITAGQDGRLLEWSLTFPAYAGLTWDGPNGCYGLSFAPDGKSITANGYDGNLVRYNARTGRQESLVRAHEKSSNWHAASADGRVVVSCSWDKTLRIFDGATLALQRTIDLPGIAAYHVAVSPDGTLVAGAMGDTTARIYDVASGAERFKLEGHTAGLQAIAFSPDGKQLATGGPDRTARLWSTQDGRALAELALPAAVSCVAFSPDGGSVAIACADGRVASWDLGSDASTWSTRVENVPLHRVVFSPDGRRLAAGGERAHLLDAATGEAVISFSPRAGDVYNVLFSPDGARLAMCSTSDWIVIVDTAPTAEQIRLFEEQSEPATP